MLKVPTFVFENEQIISNSISKVISLDSLICFVILPQTSQGYIHLKDNQSKTKLLNSKSLILQYNAPSNDNNANKNYPLDEKETKFKLEEETPNNPLCYKFIIYQVPSNKEFRIELVKVLQRISGKIFFNLLFRDGNIYIELHSNAPNFSLQPIKIKDKIVIFCFLIYYS